jgi:predicted nuclease of predicted toxin-antitoxin system
MNRFLVDEDVNQKAVRKVPTESKGFDVKFPEDGGYKRADDKAVRDLATFDRRTLVSVEKDFGKFGLKPEDMPEGAIWLRPGRISQKNVGVLFDGLCKVLVQSFPSDPYNFKGKILEVYPDRVDIRTIGGGETSYPVPPSASSIEHCII